MPIIVWRIEIPESALEETEGGVRAFGYLDSANYAEQRIRLNSQTLAVRTSKNKDIGTLD